MSEFSEGQGISRQQATPIELRPTPERRPDMARPIDSGQFGGQEGLLARTRRNLRALIGQGEVPVNRINSVTLADKLSGRRWPFLEPGQTLTHRDVVKVLGYDPNKSTPNIYQAAGTAVNELVRSGVLEIVPAGPDDQLPQYVVTSEEALRKAAHPQPVQQAKPA